MEKNLRKKQNMLGISGLAVIAFGIWNIAKLVIGAISTPDGFFGFLKSAGIEISDATEQTAFIVILIFFILIDMGLRLLIGLSARAESKGKKKSIVYLIIAVIMMLVSVLSLVTSFQNYFANSVFDMIVSLVLELTAIFALLDVVVSSIGIRSLKKKIAAEP